MNYLKWNNSFLFLKFYPSALRPKLPVFKSKWVTKLDMFPPDQIGLTLGDIFFSEERKSLIASFWHPTEEKKMRGVVIEMDLNGKIGENSRHYLLPGEFAVQVQVSKQKPEECYMVVNKLKEFWFLKFWWFGINFWRIFKIKILWVVFVEGGKNKI